MYYRLATLNKRYDTVMTLAIAIISYVSRHVIFRNRDPHCRTRTSDPSSPTLKHQLPTQPSHSSQPSSPSNTRPTPLPISPPTNKPKDAYTSPHPHPSHPQSPSHQNSFLQLPPPSKLHHHHRDLAVKRKMVMMRPLEGKRRTQRLHSCNAKQRDGPRRSLVQLGWWCLTAGICSPRVFGQSGLGRLSSRASLLEPLLLSGV